MTLDAYLLASCDKSVRTILIQTTDGSPFEATQIGTIAPAESSLSLCLSAVLHVPHLFVKLLSVNEF